jgi:H+-transporting ATPase
MIVMLALLNDGAILSIAYDNVKYKAQPEAWNMRMVLGISTVLGVIGVVAAFGLFYLGERVFHLDRPHIQTLMYLKLSVAGHLTIFLTRTRGPFWSIRPARILWMAVLGTQIVATLIAVYGLFMTPLGWKWAGFVWGYALIWFLINDRIKLLAYRIFDPVKADPVNQAKAATKPEVKDGSKPETNAAPSPAHEVKEESKPEVKDGPKPGGNSEAKPEAKADPKPDGKEEPKAEAKVESKPDQKAEPKPEAKLEAKPESKDEPKPDAKAESKPEAKDTPKPEVKAEPTPDDKDGPKPEAKVEPKPEAKTPSEVTPELVKRVHELYEELGREDVKAVQEWERAKQTTPKAAPDEVKK